jgi:hypothetical protein
MTTRGDALGREDRGIGQGGEEVKKSPIEVEGVSRVYFVLRQG